MHRVWGGKATTFVFGCRCVCFLNGGHRGKKWYAFTSPSALTSYVHDAASCLELWRQGWVRLSLNDLRIGSWAAPPPGGSSLFMTNMSSAWQQSYHTMGRDTYSSPSQEAPESEECMRVRGWNSWTRYLHNKVYNIYIYISLSLSAGELASVPPKGIKRVRNCTL